jgi:hypothetical protein
MSLLPVFPHSVDVGTGILALAGVSLALHPIGVNLDDGQWVLEFMGNMDSGGILGDIIPLLHGLNNGLDIRGLQVMLFTQMGRNLLGMDTVLALTTHNNPQFRDLLEDLVLHIVTQCSDACGI